MSYPFLRTLSGLLLVCAHLFPVRGDAQLVVDNAPTAQQLVQNVLVGNGVQVSNVTFTGDPVQIGSFDGTAANIPYDSGVVMSTGNCDDAVGPNNNGGISTAIGNTTGDPDLLSIAQQTNNTSDINDVAIIEFDLTPQGDSISFDFFFGSEEYPEFVGSVYNDVFGFFISGPGINGPYTNNAINLAKVPGTNDPIAINNINGTTNSSYYVNNGDGSTSPYDSDSAYIQADGRTVSLTAETSVQCGQTYHLALKIGDGEDQILDSWVFLQGGSLTSNALTVNSEVDFGQNDSTLWEGCGSATFDAIRQGNISNSDTVWVETGGTATEGSDYGTLPDTLFFNPGQDSTSITLNTIADNLNEGTESVVLDLIYKDPSSCQVWDTSTVNVYIADTPPLNLSTSNDTLIGECVGGVNIWASANGGVGAYDWSWSQGIPNGDSTGNVNPSSNTTYVVTVGDTCGNTATDSITVNVDTMHAVVLPPDTLTCNTTALTLDGSSSTSFSGSIDYNWTTTNGNFTSGTNSATVDVDQAGDYTLTVTDPASGCSDDTTVTVPIDTVSPEPIVNGADTLTCVQTSVTLDASATTSANGHSYSWSNGDSGPTTTVSTAGNYTLTVTDNYNGCMEDTTVTVPIDTVSPDVAIASPDTLTCVQTSVTLDASATTSANGHSYSWSNGDSGPTTTVSAAGNYTLTVMDTYNGCMEDTTVTVPIDTVSPDVAIAFPDTLTCVQTSVTLDASATTSANGHGYSWSNGDTGPTSSVNSPGTYTVTVTDNVNGCVDDTSVSVVQQNALSFSVDSINDASCSGACDGAAYISVSSGVSPYTYQWNDANNQTTQDATGLCAGTHQVVVTDDNGCTDSTQVLIDEPSEVQINSGPDTTICLGGTATLTANASGGTPGYTYHWDNGLGTGQTQTVSPGTNTLYYVHAEDANGCLSDSATVRVEYHPSLQVNASSDDSICPGESTNLSASGNGGLGSGYSYDWSNGAQGSSVNVAPGSTQEYVVTLEDGCETPAVTDTVTVYVNPRPDVQIQGQNLSGCSPVMVDLMNATPDSMVGSDCVWDFGDGSQGTGCDSVTHTYDAPGCYDVTLSVESPEGCVDSTTRTDLVCVHPYPDADFEYNPEQTSVQDPAISFTNLSSGASSYQWSFGSMDSSTAEHPTYEFPSDGAGSYEVCLKAVNAYGCPDSTCKTISIDGEFLLYVPNAFTPDGDGVNDEFYPVVQGADPADYHFYVYDRWGEVVFETHHPEGKWDGSIKGSKDASKADVYVWKLVTTNKYTGDPIVRQGHVTLIR